MEKELELIKGLIEGEFKPNSYDQKEYEKDPKAFFKRKIEINMGYANTQIADQNTKLKRLQVLLDCLNKINWKN